MIAKTTAESDTYRTEAALESYSVYSLFPEERYLFTKYYKRGDSVLDLACGVGRTTLRLYEMGCVVKGVDLSDVFINCARKRFSFLDLEIGSFTHLNITTESYDHVLISFNGIDCAYPEGERVRALQECHRVLRPGGTLIFSSHNIKSLYCSPVYLRDVKSLVWKTRYTLKAFKAKEYIRDVWADAHLFYACPKYIVRQTEQQGFRLAEMVGRRVGHRYTLARYLSPYIYYVFYKSLECGYTYD